MSSDWLKQLNTSYLRLFVYKPYQKEYVYINMIMSLIGFCICKAYYLSDSLLKKIKKYYQCTLCYHYLIASWSNFKMTEIRCITIATISSHVLIFKYSAKRIAVCQSKWRKRVPRFLDLTYDDKTFHHFKYTCQVNSEFLQELQRWAYSLALYRL